jgi:predicted Fe-S protein YdhL (DUF1289 family)
MLDADGERCVGCLRTLEEIAGWMHYSDDERRRVLDALERRAVANRGRRESSG